MISFYPGPSRLYPQIAGYMQEAFEKGILSINHRSPEFVEISRSAITLLKSKLHIPADYTVFYVSSATECWEIIAQSLVQKQSFHIYNGAFGEKWFEYTQKLKPSAKAYEFSIEQELDFDKTILPKETELICLTQNETSNGTQVSNDLIKKLRQNYPDQLIAVDATSSMGGIYLDFSNADVWYASVQKCFGLPAGMSVMICSPKAIERALQINESAHYNSLIGMIERMKDWQTTYTPNVLNIFLLEKVMNMVPDIQVYNSLIAARAKDWYDFSKGIKGTELLIKKEQLRSHTVVAISGNKEVIDLYKKEVKNENVLLGNGYGKWKSDTFRIANFPAIQEDEILKLKEILLRISLKF